MARTILLADDSVTAQNMGRRILADAGYEVITVNNGSAALKKIAEHKPDLIVLDVYMPGYGGLEVCNRLKETRETARIPVLLTVGKLEPFKPEEARRVRADAFIVKPFEASELLTALTKLEDKIVPQSQSPKPGRFAKTLATIETAEEDDRFGDKETGWKNRLIIPSGPAKPQEPEVEAPVASSSGLGNLGRGDGFQPAEPKQKFERPIPAGLPADITTEEIAAITAAAAAFDGKVEVSAAAAQTAPEAEAKSALADAGVAASEVSSAETPRGTLASGLSEQSEAVAEARPQAAAEPAVETVLGLEKSEPVGNASAESATHPTAEQPSAGPEPDATIAPSGKEPWTRDAEVLAAIASLVPGDTVVGSAPASGIPETPSINEPVQSAGAISSPPVVGASASGPRWVAETVAVSEDESRLSLEREMENAHTLIAVAEPAKTGSVGATTSVANSSPTVEVAPLEPPAAMVAAAGDTALTEAMSVRPAEAVAGPPQAGAESGDQSAFAAAASASSSPASAPLEEMTTAAGAYVENTPSPAKIDEHESDAELAAAWQNWKQIRETIVGDQLASQIADAAAAELQASQQQAESSEAETEEAVAEGAEEEAASEASGEPAAIASIVDSVLAELKPKLVAEIARKMNAEKKGKGKKSKK